MTALAWILVPLLGAVIGWMTNRIAIEMLFRPRTPIGKGRFALQGLIPRRQQELATQVAVIVEREFLSANRLRSELERIDPIPLLGSYSRQLVHQRIAPRLRRIPVLGYFVRGSHLEALERAIAEELRREAPGLMQRMAEAAEKQVSIRGIVEKRIGELSMETLESLIRRVAGREFRQIEILGALIGLLVGLIQLALMRVLHG